MYKIKIGEGSCGISAGAGKIHKLLDEKNSGNYTVHSVGCIGMCFLEPIVDIYNGDALTARLVKVSPDDVDKIISFTESGNMSQISSLVISDEDKVFLEKQTRIALRGCGITEPERRPSWGPGSPSPACRLRTGSPRWGSPCSSGRRTRCGTDPRRRRRSAAQRPRRPCRRCWQTR